jgi:hypothetical protein
MDTLFEHLPDDLFEKAASDLLSKETDRNILLFTGFASEGKQETDGPVGTYFLAKALFGLGFYPVIISDHYCKGYFDQAEQNFETLIVPVKGFGESFMYSKIIETYDPVAMISIERPGKSRDGHYRNMKGQIIDDQNAPLDLFFEVENDIMSIGIGDGGNEIGLGKFADLLVSHLDYTAPCEISTDHCLIATTSNWAAYGLIAAMDKSMLPTEKELISYYNFIIKKGAVDGITGEATLSVDGIPLVNSIAVISDLRSIV